MIPADFDVRNYRLYRRVRIFHRTPGRADGDAVLTRALALTYAEDADATTLTRIQVRGCRTKAGPRPRRYFSPSRSPTPPPL